MAIFALLDFGSGFDALLLHKTGKGEGAAAVAMAPPALRVLGWPGGQAGERTGGRAGEQPGLSVHADARTSASPLELAADAREMAELGLLGAPMASCLPARASLSLHPPQTRARRRSSACWAC